MLKKSIKSALKRSNAVEMANAVCFMMAIVFSVLIRYRGAAFMLLAIGAADITRFLLCGYWYQIPWHATAHRQCPQKDRAYYIGSIIKMLAYTTVFALSIPWMSFMGCTRTIIIHIAWYVIMGIALTECCRSLAHVLHKRRMSWLGDNEGRIGILGFTAIICCVIQVITVHIVAANTLGPAGLIVACIPVVLQVIALDIFADLFRDDYEHLTRFYGWMELIGRKLFFIGCVVAVVAALMRTEFVFMTYSVWFQIAILGAMAAVKDVVSAYWHLSSRWHLNDTTQRTHDANVVRHIAAAMWFIVTMIGISLEDNGFSSLIVIGMVAIMLASFICLVIEASDISRDDYDRPSYKEPY